MKRMITKIILSILIILYCSWIIIKTLSTPKDETKDQGFSYFLPLFVLGSSGITYIIMIFYTEYKYN